MRDKLIEFLERELFGPDPRPPFIQTNGEEVIPSGSPIRRYSTGVLFPLKEPAECVENDSEDTGKFSADHDEEPPPTDSMNVTKEEMLNHLKEKTDEDDSLMTMANAYLPSAMGISCNLPYPVPLTARIFAGRYHKANFTYPDYKGETRTDELYQRESLDTVIELNADDLPKEKGKTAKIPIKKDVASTGLEMWITNRSRANLGKDNCIYTFSLVNTLTGDSQTDLAKNSFFQVKFALESAEGKGSFLPYPEKIAVTDQDSDSNKLLYRHRCTFAIGHGCSPDWKEGNDANVSVITAEVIPKYEMKPILPYKSGNIQLKMSQFSDEKRFGDSEKILKSLCTEYEVWINEQESKAAQIPEGDMRDTAALHISNCRICLGRIRNGIRILKENDKARKAFCFMSRAMLMQQIHHGLPMKEWVLSEGTISLTDEPRFPDPDDVKTWPDWTETGGTKYGSWYPFQISFILMNLQSFTDPQSQDRKIVDVIWFPTGGGKTEAYLGLTAFLLFFRRLTDKIGSGTAVIMRYTLRLLTAQQYQRAASLMCACEVIRRQNEDMLGQNRYTIGLWVGDEFTPNLRSKACRKLNEAIEKNYSYPFIIYKCPWCGSQMGKVKSKNTSERSGHSEIITPGYDCTSGNTVVHRCSYGKCEFSRQDNPLPLYSIDEDIYENPPSVLIGTVDKFALLVWMPDRIRKLFGYRENGRITPPELIIQDELHLISGPLGSMVGHYEVLISELCRKQTGSVSVLPKIIASTATLSRAKEQVNALYGQGAENVFLFPPSAIKAGDSFFAKEETESEGRIYIGINSPSLSHASIHVRTTAALLQAVKSVDVGANNESRNYYWTIVDYFNTLRELGHAVTRVFADVPEYLSIMWQRLGLSNKSRPEERRFVNNPIELTSRVESYTIADTIKELEVNYPSDDKKKPPVDICMATNMLSVGVDISRLGLMTVTGQPKTTSEYIQATSRVGRSNKGPGLVVVIYNAGKPRDRSHYEQFHAYHSKIYSYVEPTSVTPFSAPVRERALHAILVGFVRYFGSAENMSTPRNGVSDDLAKQIREIIKKKVSAVDDSETAETIGLLDQKIAEWNNLRPAAYGNMFPDWEQGALLYPSSIKPPDEIEAIAWPTPTSMRNVDPDCQAVVDHYYQHQNRQGI